ncbi:MAG: DNA-binding protein, partial [Actinomycetota bacterium]|nr:DNA-binding protein [Actinomycetota bacterium]
MSSGITGIGVCGPLVVEAGEQRIEERLPGRQGGLVVAYLALNRGRTVARDELAELLWPADPPGDPVEALAALLSKVRSALGRDAVEGRRELRLVVGEGAEVDWDVAVDRAARAEDAVAEGDRLAAWEHARAAVEIAERGFLPGHSGPWVEERRRELEELRQAALETLAAAGVALGEPRLAGAERAARALVEAA